MKIKSLLNMLYTISISNKKPSDKYEMVEGLGLECTSFGSGSCVYLRAHQIKILRPKKLRGWNKDHNGKIYLCYGKHNNARGGFPIYEGYYKELSLYEYTEIKDLFDEGGNLKKDIFKKEG